MIRSIAVIALLLSACTAPPAPPAITDRLLCNVLTLGGDGSYLKGRPGRELWNLVDAPIWQTVRPNYRNTPTARPTHRFRCGDDWQFADAIAFNSTRTLARIHQDSIYSTPDGEGGGSTSTCVAQRNASGWRLLGCQLETVI